MNSRKILSQALLALLVIATTLMSLPSDNLVAQLQKKTQQPSKRNSPSNNSKTPWVIVGILKWLQPHKRSGGSTDRLIFKRAISSSSIPGKPSGSETGGVTIYSQDSICMLSPIFDFNTINRLWTRQPLFVWAGYSSAFQLVETQSRKTVWQKKVGKESGRIKMDVSLESGKSYTLKSFSYDNPEEIRMEATFQTVPAVEWSQINRDLLSIEQTSIAQGKTQKEIELEKAAYFAKNQLWSDVQTTILSNWQDEKEGKEINAKIASSSDDAIQNLLTEIENTFPLACKLDKL
jgi:hypothetical protein